MKKYNCPNGLDAETRSERRKGVRVSGCCGCLNVENFHLNCIGCDLYLDQDLEQRLRAQIKEERLAGVEVRKRENALKMA